MFSAPCFPGVHPGVGRVGIPSEFEPHAHGAALALWGFRQFAGLAWWRGGRFGRVITRPVEVTAPGLEINVESFELTPIRVPIRTPDGTTLPGSGFDECRANYDV